jgi:hypothetical protein
MDIKEGRQNLISEEGLKRLERFSSMMCELDVEGHCITCSDEATTVRVLQVKQESGMALVEVENQTEEVDITLVGDVIPGDTLLVHGGVAIALLEEEQ